MKIHPTAIVGSKAKLGENVEIGPYAIVEDGVTLGDNCTIQAHAILVDGVTLGARNFVGYGAVIGAAPQDVAHDASTHSEVICGDDNVFREYVTIHRGTKPGSATTVGSGNMLMCGVHVGHNSRVGNRNVLANNCLLAGHVQVSDDAVFGGGAVFHQFLRVGRMVMIRGGTAWSADIPPFTVGLVINTLGGLNSIGMKRKGIGIEGRRDVKRAFQLMYRSGRNISQALEESEGMEWTSEGSEFLDFIKLRGKRGLCRARKSRSAPADLDLD